MHTIRLDISDIYSLKKRISNLESEIDDCYRDVASVANSIDMRVRQRNDIDAELDKALKQLSNQKKFLSECATIIEDSINSFVEAEKIDKLPELNFNIDSKNRNDVTSEKDSSDMLSFNDLLIESGLLSTLGVMEVFSNGQFATPIAKLADEKGNDWTHFKQALESAERINKTRDEIIK